MSGIIIAISPVRIGLVSIRLDPCLTPSLGKYSSRCMMLVDQGAPSSTLAKEPYLQAKVGMEASVKSRPLHVAI